VLPCTQRSKRVARRLGGKQAPARAAHFLDLPSTESQELHGHLESLNPRLTE